LNSDEPIRACSEQLPIGLWSQTAAKHATAEATLIEQMLVAGKGAPWRLVLGEWQRLAWASVQRVGRRPDEGEDTVATLRERQSEIAGYRLAELVVEERLRLGIDARVHLTGLADKSPPTPGIGLKPKDAEQALLWQQRGRLALTLVETPGWAILSRRLADRAWATSWLKSVCPPELAPTLDALLKGILAPLMKLQQCIDLGACAEAWFRNQEQKAAKEGA